MQASATVACMKSGMAMVTASMFFGFLVQHRAIVFVSGLFWKVAEGEGRASVVHIAEGNDVLRLGGVVEIDSSLSAATDGGDVEFVVVGLVAERAKRWHAAESRGGNSARQETPEEKNRRLDTSCCGMV